jgi:hypothetical protein
MNKPKPIDQAIVNRRIRVAVACFFGGLLLATVYGAFYQQAPDTLPELTSTLIGTGLGAGLAAVVGVWLYDVQTRKSEDARVEQLRQALIAELYATTDRLNTTSVTRITDDEEQRPEVVLVLTHLEPTVCEEAIRSALFGHENTLNLTRLARLMREYTKAADTLVFLLRNPNLHSMGSLGFLNMSGTYEQAVTVKGLQTFVLDWCGTIFKGFKDQGLMMPPEDKYYSDPSREAPPEYVQLDE